MIIEYQAINKSGTIVADTLSAENLSQAQAELSRRGLTPVRINPRGKTVFGKGGILNLPAWLSGPFSSTAPAEAKKASRNEVAFFTSQLAIMLETGTPVAASLEAIEKQFASAKNKRHWCVLVGQMHQHVEEGGTLASATAQYPKVFDPIYTSMISAGESTGNLTKILNRLADVSRQSDRLRHKLISAMIYPVLLSIICLVVTIVLTFFVLPRFADIFVEMKVTLPRTTKTMLAISALVRQNMLIAVVLISAVTGSIVFWLRSQRGRRFIARTSLKIPIIGELITSLIIARILRMLGLLVESSVPLLESLKLTINSTRHYLYCHLIGEMHESVLQGQSMHEVMSHSRLVPPSIAQMVQTGENNGKIGRVMTMLADYLDDRNEIRISTMTSIMEPVILIFMGLIVGTLVISLVLPLFDLSRIS
ncbi:MAG: type II secretion system F family protein [Sedimentisphaerales bacterium]|nr:type II secretion system F family protein [Sedimentisphaerales bacterium]